MHSQGWTCRQWFGWVGLGGPLTSINIPRWGSGKIELTVSPGSRKGVATKHQISFNSRPHQILPTKDHRATTKGWSGNCERDWRGNTDSSQWEDLCAPSNQIKGTELVSHHASTSRRNQNGKDNLFCLHLEGTQVQQHCKQCKTCQLIKKSGRKKYGLLPVKTAETTKWKRVNVDLWGPATVKNKMVQTTRSMWWQWLTPRQVGLKWQLSRMELLL